MSEQTTSEVRYFRNSQKGGMWRCLSSGKVEYAVDLSSWGSSLYGSRASFFRDMENAYECDAEGNRLVPAVPVFASEPVKVDDGGPAFASDWYPAGGAPTQGMSLRAYFAGKAMEAMAPISCNADATVDAEVHTLFAVAVVVFVVVAVAIALCGACKLPEEMR